MFMIASMQGFFDSLVHSAGFLFVLFVLSLLWLVVELIGSFFRKADQRKAAAQAAMPAPVAQAAVVNGNEVPEEDLVIIAATATLLLGHKPHRLVSIRTSGMDWGREGRRQLLQSHGVHK